MRKNKIEKLTKAEMEFMEYIWTSEGKKTLQNFVDYFYEHSWERPTISTYLHRLTQKGFLRYEKQGRYYYYEPLISKLEYDQFQINESMKKMYGMPMEGVIASFFGKEKLSKKQLDKVREFLNELETENDN